MTLHEWLADRSEWLWPLLANHLWQATLFSTLVFVVVLLLRRGGSQARYVLWGMAGLKFALPSALLSFLIVAAGFDMSGRSVSTVGEVDTLAAISQFGNPVYEFSNAETAAASSAPHNELYCALTLAWLTGAAILFGLWAKRRLRFSRGLKAGRAVTTGREAEALGRASALLGNTRRVRLIVSSRVIEPGVWRVLRPAILLPEGMADGLSSAELEAVLAHELIHIARWDNLASNLQMALCCLLWFHPLVWLIDRRLLVEREQACDEAVIRLGAGSDVYAASLLKVLRFCIGWKVAGVSYAAGSNLRRRVERIMAIHSNTRLRIPHRVVVATAAGLLVAFSTGTALLTRGQGIARVNTVFEGNSQGAPQSRRSPRVGGGIPQGVPGGVREGVVDGIPGGVPGGVADGIPGGVPGGVVDGIPGGVPGGVADGIPGGVPGGVVDGIPGGVPGGVVDGISGGVPGGVVDGIPGGVPGGVVDGIPGGVPGGVVDGIPGGVSDGIPGGVPGGIFGGVPGGVVGLQENLKKQFDQALVTPLRFRNEDGVPFEITTATFKAVRDESSGHPGSGSDYYFVRPNITLLNTTSRVITGVAFYLMNGQSKHNIYFGRQKLRVAPHSSFTLVGFGTRLPGSVEDFTVRVVGVTFDDGSEWGEFTIPAPAPAL